MRLTLRTLLAYLDQILDEQDARELGQKINDSEIAGQLIHRIRKVLAQRTDAGISVDATEVGHEAHRVAQYLDNTLAPDQMADFERICLESDAHLSEVAGCHQILTLVLGEPATVSDSLRQRIYRLDAATAASADADGLIAPTPDVSVREEAKMGRPSDRIQGFGGLAAEAHDPGAARWTSAESRAASSRPAATPRVAAQDSDAANAAAPAGTVRRVDRAASGTAATTAINDAIDEDEHWKTAPDYLKRPRGGKWKPVLIGMLIAFCLAMAGLRGMGPFDESHPLASRLGRNRVDVPTVTADAGAAAMPPSPTNELTADPADRAASGKHANAGHERPVADALQAEPSATPANDQRDPAQASLPLDSEVDPALADASEAETVNLDPVAPAQQPLGESVDAVHEGLNDAEMPAHAVNQEEQETLESEGEPAIAANPSREALPTEPLFDPVASANEGGAAPEDELPPSEPRPPVLIDPLATNTTNESPVADTASAERLDAMPTEVRATPADAEGVDAGHSPARSMEVGRFLDPQQVLTRFQASSGLWHRIPVGTLLQVGDTLMSLPTYRTPLALASGMQVTMIGPTRLEILPVGDANTPEFQLAYGRLAVATLAQAGTTFRLRWAGNHEATLLLADMNTTVAVALEHHRLPGTDPITRPAHRVLQVFVTSGSAEWRADDAAPIQLLPGQRLTMVDEFVPQLTEVEELPSWVDGRDARPRDPIAARELSRLMTTERPVTLVLQEQSSSKREEIRSLAACSLAYLGDVAPLLVALNDSGLRSYWNAQHEVLMDLVAMSPDSAELLRSAILQRHGEQTGESLYRMLWSFSPQQLDDGAAEQLVNALDHPSFDFRIVASELLKSITGLPSLYRPHASAREPQRRTATNRWRKHLQDGEIVYGEPPAIVSWLQAAGGSAPDETDQAETPEARNAPANVQPSGDAGAVLRP